MKKLVIILLVFNYLHSFSQVSVEVNPSYNIKSVAFVQNNLPVVPYFKLGEPFEFVFDDLYGNEANYYYVVNQYTYDWQPTELVKQEYLKGMDNLRILNYQNSFNTLQLYSHYSLLFPNVNTSITKSGNYMIAIYNDDQELVFSRKFIIYEPLVGIKAEVKRSRTIETINTKQNLEFSITTGDFTIQNPMQNIKVMITQNGRWDKALYNIKPQYTLGNELLFRYNTETQFFGGNEMLYWDNKDIRLANNSIAKVTSGDVYNSFLFPTEGRANVPYTYFPDLNGSFYPRNFLATNHAIEADYSWVYFSLFAPYTTSDQKIFVAGMFSNYALTDEYQLEYNTKTGLYEKAILAKQGFTNFEYILTNENNLPNFEQAPDGNFWQTENNYFILVYYKGNADRYDRVIGFGTTNSEDIRN